MSASTTETSTEEQGIEATAAIPGDDTDHHHPTDASYIKIALLLAVITAAEVATYYVPGLEENTPLLLAVLIPMMIVKFAIVARSFMHLKFDNPLFSRVFLAGLILATAVWFATLATFQFF